MNTDPIQYTIEQFAKLPGIGERTALRLVLHLVSQERGLIGDLAEALVQLGQKVKECEICHMITADGSQCSVCRSSTRNRKIICVVSKVQDLMALESTSDFRGLYHVLHGVLAPLEGVGPSDLRLFSLIERLKAGNVDEVIVATPSTVEGEATALFLVHELSELPIKITRIASGVPVGGDLQFADRLTLSRALAMRRGF